MFTYLNKKKKSQECGSTKLPSKFITLNAVITEQEGHQALKFL